MTFFKQEDEARKRKELEEIMAENNKKIEEAQRKLVSIEIHKSLWQPRAKHFKHFADVMLIC